MIKTGRCIEVGKIYRMARPSNGPLAEVDALPNYFYYTNTPGKKLALMESGISPIAQVRIGSASRTPAIMISSSPHKTGSEDTPWQDHFDPDHGHVRYFGDNKNVKKDPSSMQGNSMLLKMHVLHSSSEESHRRQACPILFFKRVRHDGRPKGNLEFQGFGIIHKAERVTQFRKKGEPPFTNYVFEFVLFELTAESEHFPWDWISARRDGTLSEEDVLKFAPASWKRWVKEGHDSVENIRRRVVKLKTTSRNDQRPLEGSREEATLNKIYKHFDSRKHQFEALASGVASRILSCGGAIYREGWITAPSGDGGADFIGRLDIGSDFSKVKLVVLGQAKCESFTTPTSGKDIARTVARLRRGWIGVYVTTSYFSENAQTEVLEDKYPVLLVNGLRVAREVMTWSHEAGLSVEELLSRVSLRYNERIRHREAEQILYD